MWCWHRWTKWEEFKQGVAWTNSKTNQEVYSFDVYQKRVCTKCGFTDVRRVY